MLTKHFNLFSHAQTTQLSYQKSPEMALNAKNWHSGFTLWLCLWPVKLQHTHPRVLWGLIRNKFLWRRPVKYVQKQFKRIYAILSKYGTRHGLLFVCFIVSTYQTMTHVDSRSLCEAINYMFQMPVVEQIDDDDWRREDGVYQWILKVLRFCEVCGDTALLPPPSCCVILAILCS